MTKLRDAIDAEHVEQTLATKGYALMEARIRETAARTLRELAGDLDEYRTARARGMLAGLELALEAPRLMLREWCERGGQ